MADVTFSDLPAIVTLADGDFFAVDDVSADDTVRISAAEVRAYVRDGLHLQAMYEAGRTIAATTAEGGGVEISTVDDITALLLHSTGPGGAGVNGLLRASAAASFFGDLVQIKTHAGHLGGNPLNITTVDRSSGSVFSVTKGGTVNAAGDGGFGGTVSAGSFLGPSLASAGALTIDAAEGFNIEMQGAAVSVMAQGDSTVEAFTGLYLAAEDVLLHGVDYSDFDAPAVGDQGGDVVIRGGHGQGGTGTRGSGGDLYLRGGQIGGSTGTGGALGDVVLGDVDTDEVRIGAAATPLTIVSTGRLRGVAGLVGTPTYSFGTSTNTGIYLPGAGVIGFACSGSQAMQVANSTGISMGMAGTEAIPMFTFVNDLDTGIFFETDTFGVSTGAVGFRYMNRAGTTTNATPASLAAITLDDEAVYAIEATIVARDLTATSAERAVYCRHACVYREGGGAATLQGAVSTPTTIETSAGLDATIVVSGNTAVVQVTGILATNIRWRCMVRYMKVTTS